jgi:hypothetical protein
MQGISPWMRKPSTSAPCKAYGFSQLVFVTVQYVAGLLLAATTCTGGLYSPPVRMSVSTAGSPSVLGPAISCPHEGPLYDRTYAVSSPADCIRLWQYSPPVTRAATALKHAKG